MKKFIGGLLVISMTLVSAISALAVNNNTQNPQGPTNITTPNDAYCYFVAAGFRAPEDAVPNTNGGSLNGTTSIWGPSAVIGETTDKSGADGQLDFTLSGNYSANQAGAFDTEYLAHGANVGGCTATFALTMPEVTNAAGNKGKLGDNSQGFGHFYIAVDGQGDHDNQILPNGIGVYTINLTPVNVDLVSRIRLELAGVGEEVPSGSYSGHMDLTIAVP